MKRSALDERRKRIIHWYCDETQPITNIAEAFDVTCRAIYGVLKAAGIQTRPRGQRPRRQLGYQKPHAPDVEKKLPVYKIAKILKESEKLIERKLERHNIEHVPPKYRPVFPSEIDGLAFGGSCAIARRPSRVAHVSIYQKAAVRGMKVSVPRIE